MDDLLDRLERLETTVDSPRERQRVRETMRVARRLRGGTFGRRIVGFDRADAAEAVVGSVIVGIPMFVEGGTAEVGAHLAGRPLALAGTLLGGVALVTGLLYVADIQDVGVQNPLFGVVPRRLVGVLFIALATATVVMTAWGRVAWSDPWLAASQVAVAFVPMTVGAALTDILPGT